jgi:hypothetical protein
LTGSKVPAVILLLVGSLELVLAAGFGIVAWLVPLLRIGFVLTAAILGVTGVGLLLWGRSWWKKAANVQRVKAEGVPGQAQIIGLRQTGLYVNNQPQVELQLQVTTAMHAPYPVTCKEVVPLILMGRLTSGQPLPVMVDPARPESVVVLWESALGPPAAGLGSPLPTPARAADVAAEKKRLLATGVRGSATILQCQSLGMFDADGSPVYDLLLQIVVPGQPPLQGPVRVGVPREREHRFRTGERLPIKADPTQPGRMAVDWDSL